MKKIYRIQKDIYGWATPWSQIDICYKTKEAARAALLEIIEAEGEVTYEDGVYLVDKGERIDVIKPEHRKIDGEEWYKDTVVEEIKYEIWRIREVTLK